MAINNDKRFAESKAKQIAVEGLEADKRRFPFVVYSKD
jgi:hypothetical protein